MSGMSSSSWLLAAAMVAITIITVETRRVRRQQRWIAVAARCDDARRLRALGYDTLTDRQIRDTPGAPILLDCAWNRALQQLLSTDGQTDPLVPHS